MLSAAVFRMTCEVALMVLGMRLLLRPGGVPRCHAVINVAPVGALSPLLTSFPPEDRSTAGSVRTARTHISSGGDL